MLRGEKKGCSICGEEFGIDHYYETKKGSGKYRKDCKSCCVIRSKRCAAKNPGDKRANMSNWYKTNKQAHSANNHDGMLRRTYGIGVDDYHSMLDSQGGKCANKACAGIVVRNTRRMNVDHDHITGYVRGLLCSHCNLALGHVDDRIETLIGLVDYLNMNDGTNHGGRCANA